jgi:hypothetical protein
LEALSEGAKVVSFLRMCKEVLRAGKYVLKLCIGVVKMIKYAVNIGK